jgi:tetratricopeptide (TPR) repeat protein
MASAAAHFDRALELDPSNTLALKERAGIDLARGHDQKALARLDRAVAADPFDPELRYQRSLILARLGRRKDADADRVRSEQLRREHARMAEVELALVATPRDIPLRVEAARWMIAHGRGEEGIAWARMVLQDQPDNPDANHYRLHTASAGPSAGTEPATTHSK